ncbi:Mg-dependent DNase [Ramicandelaber brevisporus]|nr:Mg-dependent DNase [Ramicandelaber brevisporus]
MPRPRLIDIAVNLTDPVFRGLYRGKQLHQDDLTQVLARASAAGITRIMVTGGSLSESSEALALCREFTGKECRLYSTVGCHPTRCDEFDKFEPGEDGLSYFDSLLKVANDGIKSGHVVAIGECGLDYDRTQFCQPEIQQKYFEKQFDLAEKTRLPMFLHCRSAADDFIEIVKRNRHKFTTGVVHSFTGTLEEAMRMIDELDLYIGLNGCSLKTSENVEVAAKIPANRIMLETDAPWCGCKPTHAGYKHLVDEAAKPSQEEAKPAKKKQQSASAAAPEKPLPPDEYVMPAAVKPEKFVMGLQTKGRSEPCGIRHVLQIISESRGMKAAQLADIVYATTTKVFFP